MNILKRKFTHQFLCLLFALFLPVAIQAQTQTKKVENQTLSSARTGTQDYKLNSKLMAREMPYRVILPTNYQTSNEKTFYPTIYLLHGLTGHFDNWTDKTKLAEYASKHNYIIVTPEGNNGWYSDSITVANDRYESYIIQELIPEVEKKFRVQADRNHRAVAGLSMGGYGSIKFGLKYPQMFALVGSFSGALGAASFTEKNAGAIGKSLTAIFGAEESDTRTSNDIFKIARELSADKIKTLPFIYLDCGTEDFLFQNNRDFINVLIEKKIPHEFRQLPGAHDWKFWDSQIKEFLEVSEKFIK